MCQIPQQVDFSNPDDVIRFIVDNNPVAVRNNFSKFGINVGGLTPCMMKDKLIALNNSGQNIAPLLLVPVNTNANNYTTEVLSAMRNAGDKASTEEWLTGIGNVAAGIGTAIGAIFGGGSSQPQPTITAPQQNYMPFIIGGFALVAVLTLILFLKK